MSLASFISAFGGAKPYINQRLLNVANFHEIQSASEGVALLKHAIEVVKNDDYTEASLLVALRLADEKSKSTACQLGDLGISASLDAILGQKIQSSSLCKIILAIIVSLMSLPEQDMIGSSQRRGSRGVQTGILTAIDEGKSKASGSVFFAGICSNRKRLSTSTMIYKVVKCCTMHSSDLQVLKLGLYAVHIFIKESGETGKLLSCGACEVICQVIRHHPLEEQLIILACDCADMMLKFDVDDCGGSLGCQEKFGDNLMCELVVAKILQSKLNPSLEVASCALKLVGSLARRNESMKDRLASVGICEAIIQLSTEEFLQGVSFAEAVCWCIANISFPCEENQSRLGHAGACPLVKTILRLHSREIFVVQEACRALHQLGEGHQQNLVLFTDADLPVFCIELLNQYKDQHEVLQWIIYALASLTASSVALEVLKKVNIAGEILSLLSRNVSNEDLVQWSAICLVNLTHDPSLAEVLNDNHCPQILIQALVHHMGSADVIEELLYAVGSVATTIPSSKTILADNSIADFIIKALEQNSGSESAIEQGFYAISRILAFPDKFAEGNESTAMQSAIFNHIGSENKRLYMSIAYGWLQSNAMKLVARLSFTYHERNATIALYSVQLIASIVIGGVYLDERLKLDGKVTDRIDSSIGSFGANGACAVLCSLLTKYRQDADIAFWCLYGLAHLSSNIAVARLMRSSDVSSLLVHIMEVYLPSNGGLVNLCLEVICNLCLDADYRGILGNSLYKGNDNSHIVLNTLRYHFHDARIVAAACRAINALCFSSADDAFSSLFEARSVAQASNIKMKVESDENSRRRSSGTMSSDWNTFSENTDHLNNIISPEQSPIEEVIPENSVNKTSSETILKRLSMLKWIGKGREEDPASITGTSKVSTTISAHYEQSLSVAQEGSNAIIDAAKALISTGLSDQEEKMILALKQRASQKKNSNDSLVECGCLVMIKQICSTYSSNCFVLIQAVNALNSLALHPANRVKIRESGVIETVAIVYSSAVNSYQGDYIKDLWDIEMRDMLDSDWNRVLVIISSIALGTFCLVESNKVKGGEVSRLETQGAAVRANQSLLNTLGVLQIFCLALSKGMRDVVLCEALLRALYLTVAENEDNQNCIGKVHTKDDYSVLFLIVQTLREKMEVPRIAYYSCVAIASLASGNETNSSKFNEFGVCKFVLRVLSRYMEYEEVVEAACQAIHGLKLLNDSLGQGGACEYVLQALTMHPSRATVAEWACRAIGSLAESKLNKIEFEKHQVSKIITNTLQKHVGNEGILSGAFTKDKSSAGVAQWGCTAIYYLAKGYDAERFQNRLVSFGACEAVAKALMKYAEVESVAYSCCRALVVLVDNNESLRSKPILSGVCQYIVESLHLFPSSVLVAKWGCRAAAVLAESHEANISKLGAAGACESIPLIIQSHPDSEHVAIAGCKVIAFMSEQTNNGYAARFGHAGACEAVVSVLRRHMKNPSAAARASIAITTLAAMPGNARWFGPAGVCEVLQAALVLHLEDEKVAKFVVAAIGQLCIIEHNKERLGSLGVCETVVQAANKHVADLETAQSCANTIGKLCEGFSKANTGTSASISNRKEYANLSAEVLSTSSHFEAGRLNRAILFCCGACEFLVSALEHHLAFADAAYCICKAISLVCQKEPCYQERERLGQLEVCQAITKALLYHEGNEEVATYGCYAVQSLTLGNMANKLKFYSAGVCPIVVQVLRWYRHSPSGAGATEAAGRAIGNLSMNCMENKLALGAAGACEGLLDVLELFVRSLELSFVFVKALFNVCDGNSINRVKIAFSGAADILHTLLLKYADEEKLVDYILSIMIGIAMDKVGQSKLGSVGVPKILQTLANRYEKSEHILMLSIVLIGVLSKNSKANQEKFGANNVFKVITMGLAKYTASTSARAMNKRFISLKKSVPKQDSSDIDEARGKSNGEEGQGKADEAQFALKSLGDGSLVDYIGEVNLVKEACRATYYLCYDSEENKKRATVAGVLDTLTAIVSSTSSSTGQEQDKVWARNAMELLMIST